MRSAIAAIAMTIGSAAFQMTILAGKLNAYTWLAPYLWVACALLWIVFLVSHPKLWKKQPPVSPPVAGTQVSGIGNTTAMDGSVAVGRDAYFGYPPPPPPVPIATTDKPNLKTDFTGALLGPIYLTPEGVWSASYSGSGAKWTGLRVKVWNPTIPGKRVGTATDISVRVKFEHDTGLDAGSAAPTAWLHEKRGYVEIKPEEEKQAIIAVCSESDWYTVTNTRDAAGYPPNTSAMHFQQAPWFSGKLHVALVSNGEAIAEEHYSWKVDVTYVGGIPRSGIPHIRPLP